MPDHPNDFALHTELAKALPDIPRFIESRGMLLANRCKIFGFEESECKSFVVCHNEVGLISVIGKPSIEAIRQAVEGSDKQGAVLAFDDNYLMVKEGLPNWQSEKATLYLLVDSPTLPCVPDGRVRFLKAEEVESLTGISGELKEELVIESKVTRIAATIIDDQAVSFCYAGAVTESLWDISIDTREGFRHQGYAALCVAFMIDHFNRQGKKPVWGAVESNTASMNLAAKLGFVPVDELYVFER